MKAKYKLENGISDLHAHINYFHDRFLTGPYSRRDERVTGLIYDLATMLNVQLAKKLVKQIKAAGFETGDWGTK